MITKENLSLKIHACGLRSSHIVKYSHNLIKGTQASQWINFMHNRVGLGKAVMVMMWMMCEILELEKSSGEPKEVLEQNDLLGIGSKLKGNSFLVNDKINVMSGSFIRKANGVYFNYDGEVYLSEGFDDICIFEKDGKERSLIIGSGTFGKFEMNL